MAPLSMPAFDPIRRLQHVSLSIHNYLPFQFNFPRQSILSIGLPRWLSDKESACQCRRHQRCGFNPWVRKIPWRRKWQSTPVFLPGESCGQRSLMGYSPWGRKDADTAERLSMSTNWKEILKIGVLRTDLIITLVYLSKHHLNWCVNSFRLSKGVSHCWWILFEGISVLVEKARLSTFETELCYQWEQSLNGLQQNFIAKAWKAINIF